MGGNTRDGSIPFSRTKPSTLEPSASKNGLGVLAFQPQNMALICGSLPELSSCPSLPQDGPGHRFRLRLAA